MCRRAGGAVEWHQSPIGLERPSLRAPVRTVCLAPSRPTAPDERKPSPDVQERLSARPNHSVATHHPGATVEGSEVAETDRDGRHDPAAERSGQPPIPPPPAPSSSSGRRGWVTRPGLVVGIATLVVVGVMQVGLPARHVPPPLKASLQGGAASDATNTLRTDAPTTAPIATFDPAIVKDLAALSAVPADFVAVPDELEPNGVLTIDKIT